MPMFEPLNHHPQDPDSHELNHLAADNIPLDPLLKSGTYIDHHPDHNGDVERAHPRRSEPPDSESERPAVETTTTASETPLSQRRPRRGPEEAVAAVPSAMAERPDWLPESWRMDFRVRTSGITAGAIDRYYVEPVSGRRFRSKNEVLHFLETGSMRKRKLNPDADMPSESSGDQKQNKSGSRTKNTPAFNFNFNNAPKEVSWVLTDASSDSWMPFVGDETVSEASKQEWAAVFSHLSQVEKNGGNMN